jgi:2-polyprenyl-3-methyl-5-hydroxy-6-metoxy-1,4-benzoquinol methylase
VIVSQHALETAAKIRFGFGANWSRFLKRLTRDRIENAETSLRKLLDVQTLSSKRLLDAGSGSGLFSLAARRLGASVHSFDFDPQSVACTAELKRRYAPSDPQWTVEEGSVLDLGYLAGLGKFDIVYSWGVLHHTGQMHQAFNNIVSCVAAGGTLVIAIYNDQGFTSRYWTAVKRLYNRSRLLRPVVIAFHFPYLVGVRFAVRALTGRLSVERGMSLWYDCIDWLGGYPFEVAKPEQILAFFRPLGFTLQNMTTCGGRHGCNEFVLRKGSGS